MTTLTEFIARVEASDKIWILRQKENGQRVTHFSNDGPPSAAYVKYIVGTDIEKLVKLVRAQDQIIKQHLATMETINERMGWQFTQPLINTHEKLKKQCEEILNE